MSNDELEHLDQLLASHYRGIAAANPQQRQAILNKYVVVEAAVRDKVDRRHTSRQLLTWLSAAAGLATIAAGLAIFVASTERMVYGIDAVPRRLAEVKTIRQRGQHFIYDYRHPDREPIRVPFEYLVERPGRYRMSSYGASYGEHDPPLIRKFTNVCDGRLATTILDQDKLVVTTELSELDAWLKTEFLAQMFLDGLFGPTALTYRQIGQETIRGRECDIYEGRESHSAEKADDDSPDEELVFRIWVDPKLGYPLRSETDIIGPDGKPRRNSETDEIAIDEPVAADEFRVEKPAGFEQRNIARSADASPLDPHYTGAGYGFSDKMETWYALQVSDDAILLVWRRSAPSEDAKDGWLENVSFRMLGADDHSLSHTWLYESHSPERWNWSLLRSSGNGLTPRGSLLVELHTRRLSSRIHVPPLKFPDERLAQLIEAAAVSTLPADAPRFSLQQIRRVLEGARPDPAQSK